MAHDRTLCGVACDLNAETGTAQFSVIPALDETDIIEDFRVLLFDNIFGHWILIPAD